MFKGHKIDAKAVAGSNYIKDFTLGMSENVFVTETTVYLNLSYCEPETDYCQTYILAFCANGQVRKVQTASESFEGDMDGYVFDVYDFYAMYVNELTQPQPNKAAIQKVLNKCKAIPAKTIRCSVLASSSSNGYVLSLYTAKGQAQIRASCTTKYQAERRYISACCCKRNPEQRTISSSRTCRMPPKTTCPPCKTKKKSMQKTTKFKVFLA